MVYQVVKDVGCSHPLSGSSPLLPRGRVGSRLLWRLSRLLRWRCGFDVRDLHPGALFIPRQSILGRCISLGRLVSGGALLVPLFIRQFALVVTACAATASIAAGAVSSYPG